MGPDELKPLEVLFADDDPLGLAQERAQQRADACRTGTENEHGVIRCNFRNPGSPEAGGQNVAYEQRLPVGH